ncbi:hypothetical protein MRX96_010604 [Rhipicephalus microplus]
MEVTVEGHTISAEELQAGNWTPVLYKAYASRPACSQKPLSQPNATVKETNPNAMRVEAAATGRGKTPTHLPPATKETRIIVKRSKQLPPLPPNAIRVVVRPRGQLRLLDVPTPRLMKAVQAALQTTLPDDFCLRIHPTNNTFTAATTHSRRSRAPNHADFTHHWWPCLPLHGLRGTPHQELQEGSSQTPLTTRRQPSCTKTWSNGILNTLYSQPDEWGRRTPFSSPSTPMRCHIPLNTWEPFTAVLHTAEVRMLVRTADYRAIVTTYAQAPRLIFAHAVAANTHPRNLLARLSAFCARALILPALVHAKDATFTSHAKRQSNLKRSDKNRFHTGTTSPSCQRDPLSPANSANPSKPGPSRLNKIGALPVRPARTHYHQQ